MHPETTAASQGAAALCQYHKIKLRPEGLALLHPDLSVRAGYRLLVDHDCLADARRVLAHALPKRRALWWGCLCALHSYRPQPPGQVAAAIGAVARFVQDPTETNRRMTGALGREAQPNTLAGCLAMAAFCSSGSLSRPGLPIVPPRHFVTGRLVGVAVYLASVRRDPARYRQHLRQYLAVGEEVARGLSLWPERRPAPAPAGEGGGAVLQASAG